jgi:hypothetical protein
MKNKIDVFSEAKCLNKRIAKLKNTNQEMAVSYASELSYQFNLFVKDLELQEDLQECLLK